MTLSWDGSHLGNFDRKLIKERNIAKKYFYLYLDQEQIIFDETKEIKCNYHHLPDLSFLIIDKIQRLFSLPIQPYHLIKIGKKDYFIFPVLPSLKKNNVSWKDISYKLQEQAKLLILFLKLAEIPLFGTSILLDEQNIYLNMTAYIFPERKVKVKAPLYELIFNEEKELIIVLLQRILDKNLDWNIINQEMEQVLFDIREICENVQQTCRGNLSHYFVQKFYDNWCETILLYTI